MRRVFLIWGVCLGMLSGIHQANARTNELQTQLYVEGEVIVQFESTWTAPAIAASHNATISDEIGDTDYSLVASETLSTQELIEVFSEDASVRYIQPNYIYYTTAETIPWGIDTEGVEATAAHASDVTGDGIVVAVIDTGVDYNHPDLDDVMWNAPDGGCLVDGTTIACPSHGYDFVSSDSSGDGDGQDNDPLDYHVHGTHVAGTIAAEDNSEGVIGVAPGAEIMAIRVLSATGFGTTADIASGIDFATDNGADVINMSIGASSYDATLEESVIHAWESGVVVVSAAGNESIQEISYPAGFEHSISVAAIQETTEQNNPDENMDTRQAYFSNYGTIDVAAPGMRVNSTVCDCNGYDGTYSGNTFNGTSMASPHVAGVAALILSQHPTFSPDQVKHVLESTATDLGETGRDQIYGSGLVNATEAINSLESSVVLVANYAESNDIYAPTIHLPELPADGESEAPVFAKIMDSDGDFVNNDSVEFTTTHGTFLESGTTTYSTTTNTSGIAEATLQAADSVGTATVTASSTYGTAAIDIPTTNILFVSDNLEWANGNTLSWWHRQSLYDINRTYARFDTMRQHANREQAPSAEYLAKFDLVIWALGEYNLTEENQITLQSYLDAGGNVLLSGQDTLYYASNDVISDDFFANYFKTSPDTDSDSVTYVGDNGGSNVSGADIFDEITIDLVELTTSGSGPDYTTGLLPDWGILESGGTAIATYDDVSGELAGTKVDSGIFRSLFLGFAFEAVELRDSRNAMMFEMVNFLLNDDTSSRPENLEFSNITKNSITVSWDYTPNDADYYSVYYGTNPTADNLGILEVTNSAETSISDLLPNTRIYVKVRANVNGVDSAFSNTGAILTAPEKPTHLTLKKRGTSFITPQWETDSASQFTISYGTNSSATNIGTTETTETFKKVSGLRSNRAYYFKVRADNETSSSAYTKPKKIRTKPARVKNLTITNIRRNSVTIRFTKVRRPVSKYTIQLKNVDNNSIQTYSLQGKSITIDDLSKNTQYSAKVRAIKNHVKGQWSAKKTFKTL